MLAARYLLAGYVDFGHHLYPVQSGRFCQSREQQQCWTTEDQQSSTFRTLDDLHSALLGCSDSLDTTSIHRNTKTESRYAQAPNLRRNHSCDSNLRHKPRGVFEAASCSVDEERSRHYQVHLEHVCGRHQSAEQPTHPRPLLWQVQRS